MWAADNGSGNGSREWEAVNAIVRPRNSAYRVPRNACSSPAVHWRSGGRAGHGLFGELLEARNFEDLCRVAGGRSLARFLGADRRERGVRERTLSCCGWAQGDLHTLQRLRQPCWPVVIARRRDGSSSVVTDDGLEGGQSARLVPGRAGRRTRRTLDRGAGVAYKIRKYGSRRRRALGVAAERRF